MLALDNVTTIYLTGLIAIGFSIVQLLLLLRKGSSVLLWSLGTLLMGLGYIMTLMLVEDPLPQFWVAGPIAVLLGSLVILSGLGKWAGYELPKKASIICLVGVAITAGLFYFSRKYNAPLGSLEAILLAPISAALIYSAWFTGVQAKLSGSKYIYLISGVYWVKGIFMAVLTLGALAAIGDQYIIVTSQVVYYTSLVFLLSTLINNMSWSLQISEDLMGKLPSRQTTQPVIIKTPVAVKTETSVANKTEKVIKEKKIIEKTETIDNNSVNPDLLSDAEKLAMLDKLTDKEREVFLLAAEGKKNGEIATLLNSSESSIKVHRSRMTGKLGMKKPEDLKKMLSKAPAVTNSQNVEIDQVTEVANVTEVSSESGSDNQNPDLFTKS